MDRFFHASNSDLQVLEQNSSSTNTKRSTLIWLRVFTNWKITHCYNVEIESYKTADHNVIRDVLCRFIKSRWNRLWTSVFKSYDDCTS